MKSYTDVFKHPITKDQVITAVQLIVGTNDPRTMYITRRLGIGYGKASAIMELLEDAGVVSLVHNRKRTVILRSPDTATNAALRQLKKGNG